MRKSNGIFNNNKSWLNLESRSSFMVWRFFSLKLSDVDLKVIVGKARKPFKRWYFKITQGSLRALIWMPRVNFRKPLILWISLDFGWTLFSSKQKSLWDDSNTVTNAKECYRLPNGWNLLTPAPPETTRSFWRHVGKWLHTDIYRKKKRTSTAET